MAQQITNYQCPACNAPLRYDGKTGKLQCDYCGSSFDVAEVEEYYARKNEQAVDAFNQKEAEQTHKSGLTEEEQAAGWTASDTAENWGVEDGMRVYNCPSCGAQLICDETTAATTCPYCGNPTVVPGQFSGTKKPDYMIPFVLSKQDAEEKLKEHLKTRPFLPKSFASDHEVSKIQGVYVPFWLFDGKADAAASYEATRSHRRRQGDYMVTTTNHFSVQRAGIIPFEKIPVDGSKKMPNDYMDSIEPFDYSKLVEYSNAYLPGFLADVHDESIEDCAPRADERAIRSALNQLRSTVTGYETVSERSHQVDLARGKVYYALLPVWMLHSSWQGNDYLFAMNGQTGKMVSNLPTSGKRFFLKFLQFLIPITAVAVGLSFLF